VIWQRKQFVSSKNVELMNFLFTQLSVRLKVYNNITASVT